MTPEAFDVNQAGDTQALTSTENELLTAPTLVSNEEMQGYNELNQSSVEDSEVDLPDLSIEGWLGESPSAPSKLDLATEAPLPRAGGEASRYDQLPSIVLRPDCDDAAEEAEGGHTGTWFIPRRLPDGFEEALEDALRGPDQFDVPDEIVWIDGHEITLEDGPCVVEPDKPESQFPESEDTTDADMRAALARYMPEIDRDGDGEMSPEELEAFLARNTNYDENGEFMEFDPNSPVDPKDLYALARAYNQIDQIKNNVDDPGEDKGISGADAMSIGDPFAQFKGSWESDPGIYRWSEDHVIPYPDQSGFRFLSSDR